MQDADTNPYSPASPTLDSTAIATRWRLVPASISFLFGLASYVFGMFAIAVMAYVSIMQNANESLGGMIAGCTLYLGFGVSWMLAGWLYWRRSYRVALMANGFGVLVSVVLFAILGA